jgi:hypothetical protein
MSDKPDQDLWFTETSLAWAILKVFFGGANKAKSDHTLSFVEKAPLAVLFIPGVRHIAWLVIRIILARAYMESEGYWYDKRRYKLVSWNIVEPLSFEDALWRWINAAWKEEESQDVLEVTNVQVNPGPFWTTVQFFAKGGQKMALVGVARTTRTEMDDLLRVVKDHAEAATFEEDVAKAARFEHAKERKMAEMGNE